jgi:hypothetical protein
LGSSRKKPEDDDLHEPSLFQVDEVDVELFGPSAGAISPRA